VQRGLTDTQIIGEMTDKGQGIITVTEQTN
jgi:hypothetical protein